MELPGLVKGVPALGWNGMGVELPSNPNHSGVLCSCNMPDVAWKMPNPGVLCTPWVDLCPHLSKKWLRWFKENAKLV